MKLIRKVFSKKEKEEKSDKKDKIIAGLGLGGAAGAILSTKALDRKHDSSIENVAGKIAAKRGLGYTSRNIGPINISSFHGSPEKVAEATKVYDRYAKHVKRKINKSKGIALGTGMGLLAGAAGYATYKHHKNKKKDE